MKPTIKLKTIRFGIFSLSARLFGLALIIAIFQACTPDSLEEEDLHADKEPHHYADKVDEIIYDKAIELGLNPETIEEYEDFYLVEGDLLFYKKDLEENNKSNKKGETAHRHAHSHNLVSQTNVTTMRVFVENSIPTSGTDNWRSAVNYSVNAYNNVNDIQVNFIYTTSSTGADITIKSDNGALRNNVIAAANFPINNQPYHTIMINLDFLNNMNVSEGTKRYNMAHELGHCIGLRHTNWDINGEPAEPYGANLIPGTPSQDPNSIMNGGTATNTWNGFSNYDIIALQYLYPSPPPTQNTFNGPTYVNVTNPNAQGTLTIVNSTALKLSAYGGSGSTSLTLNISNFGTYSLYAGYGESKSSVTPTIPPGTYNYSLSGSFSGSSGNSGSISFN